MRLSTLFLTMTVLALAATFARASSFSDCPVETELPEDLRTKMMVAQQVYFLNQWEISLNNVPSSIPRVLAAAELGRLGYATPTVVQSLLTIGETIFYAIRAPQSGTCNVPMHLGTSFGGVNSLTAIAQSFGSLCSDQPAIIRFLTDLGDFRTPICDGLNGFSAQSMANASLEAITQKRVAIISPPYSSQSPWTRPVYPECVPCRYVNGSLGATFGPAYLDSISAVPTEVHSTEQAVAAIRQLGMVARDQYYCDGNDGFTAQRQAMRGIISLANSFKEAVTAAGDEVASIFESHNVRGNPFPTSIDGLPNVTDCNVFERFVNVVGAATDEIVASSLLESLFQQSDVVKRCRSTAVLNKMMTIHPYKVVRMTAAKLSAEQ